MYGFLRKDIYMEKSHYHIIKCAPIPISSVAWKILYESNCTSFVYCVVTLKAHKQMVLSSCHACTLGYVCLTKKTKSL